MSKILFLTQEDKSNSSHRVMFCLLYCINTKSHVIDIFTSEDMENMSLCISLYLTLYFLTRKYMHAETLALLTKPLYFPNMKYLK